MNELDKYLIKMYTQLLESDKTSPETKWEAGYWLHVIREGHLYNDPDKLHPKEYPGSNC